MDELKPCPFCGSGYIDASDGYCGQCGASGPRGWEGHDETWNTRPRESALIEERDAARSAGKNAVDERERDNASWLKSYQELSYRNTDLAAENARLREEVELLCIVESYNRNGWHGSAPSMPCEGCTCDACEALRDLDALRAHRTRPTGG